MKHIHTFESFLNEAEQKIGHIVVKNKKELAAMSTEELKGLYKTIDAYIDEEVAKSRKSNTPESQREYEQKVNAALPYLKLVAAIAQAREKQGDGDAKAATDAVVKYLAGAIKDDNLSKSEAAAWLKGKEGTTAANGALEAGEDDFGTVSWSGIKKDVTAKIMAMDIFTEGK